MGTCAPLQPIARKGNMPRSRTAVKRHKVKVVRQTVKKKTRSVKEAVVGNLWKEKKTVRANYAAMGLAATVNSDADVANQVQTCTGRIKNKSRVSNLSIGSGQLQIAGSGALLVEGPEENPDEEQRHAVDILEEATQYPAAPRLFMFEGDQEFIEGLIAKHGETDYVKMARDRLNVYQHTPAQIKKKVLKYIAYRASFESGERGGSKGVAGMKEGRKGAMKLPNSTWNTTGGKIKTWA